MIASRLKLIVMLVSLTAILLCAWAKPLDTIAMHRVDEGFKRAIVSFGTARLIGAVISVAQGTDVIMQPLGVGVKFAPGQLLQPISDFVGKFGDLMFAATVSFGAMKMLLTIGGSTWLSLAATCITLWWFLYLWRGHPSPDWLSNLAVVLLLVRFAVPVVMVGSDAVFQQFLAADYKTSQAALDAPVGVFGSNPNAQNGGALNVPPWVPQNNPVVASIKSMAQGATTMVDHMIKVIVVFLLQTLVIPLLLFWALYRVLTAMFQNSVTSPASKGEERQAST